MRLLILLFCTLFSFEAVAMEVLRCPLSDGSFFELKGRRLGVLEKLDIGPHYVHSAGRPSDGFAYAYSIIYHRVDGAKTSLRDFNDNNPDCRNYGITDNKIFVIADAAIFRYLSPTGKWGDHVFVISNDGGRSFGENIHPARWMGVGDVTPMQEAFSWFGFQRYSFQIVGNEYRLELVNPLLYEDFMLFTSRDGGKSWERSYNKEPLVFVKDLVQKERDRIASVQWFTYLDKAQQQACRPQRLPGCDQTTESFWRPQWEKCRERYSGRECLQRLPAPTPVAKP